MNWKSKKTGGRLWHKAAVCLLTTKIRQLLCCSQERGVAYTAAYCRQHIQYARPGNVTVFTSSIHVPSECDKISALGKVVIRDKYSDFVLTEIIGRYFYEQIAYPDRERCELQTSPDAGKTADKRRISRGPKTI